MQDPNAEDDVNGAGLGLVDIYDTSGKFLTHLVPTGGSLNAPWGLVLAQLTSDLSRALLVGISATAKINASTPIRERTGEQ